MRTSRKKLGVAIALVAAVGVLLWLALARRLWASPFERLADPARRMEALRDLLHANQVAGVPEEALSASAERQGFTNYVECVDQSGRKIAVVMVTYPVPSAGHRSHSFAFDETGRCLLSSKDSHGLYRIGVLDITGDGWFEKVVCFLEEDMEPRLAWVERLQVFSFGPEGTTKLLDVLYNLLPDPMFERHVSPRLTAWRPPNIELSSPGVAEKTVFSWSPEQRSFTVSGERSENWRLVFPEDSQEKDGTGPPRGPTTSTSRTSATSTRPGT